MGMPGCPAGTSLVRGDLDAASGYGDPLGVPLLTGKMGMDEGEFVGASGNGVMGERPCTVRGEGATG